MRIDIDERLEAQLKEIKRKAWIRGRGYTETVRMLANKYDEYQSIKELLENKLKNLDAVLEKGIRTAIKAVIQNLLQ